MLGRLGNMKQRRGKCGSERRGFKFSAKRKQAKRPMAEMAHPKAVSSPSDCRVCACSKPSNPAQRLPHISECQRREKHPSCEAVPNLGDEWEGKENEMRVTLESDHCRIKSFSETMEGEEKDASSKNIFPNEMFPDDNSNQILPVEQFFGNLEVVQDCPQRPSSSSTWGKREHRRQRYYAKEDSDDEEGLSDMQPDVRGES